MDSEQLTLRKMSFDGIAYDDDWLVMWQGLNIGRILKQSGGGTGAPTWFWSISLDGTPQPTHWRGHGAGLADCQRQFKAAWATIRPSLTDEKIEGWRRCIAAPGSRISDFGYKRISADEALCPKIFD